MTSSFFENPRLIGRSSEDGEGFVRRVVAGMNTTVAAAAAAISKFKVSPKSVCAVHHQASFFRALIFRIPDDTTFTSETV